MRLDDQGNIDYGVDPFQPPAPGKYTFTDPPPRAEDPAQTTPPAQPTPPVTPENSTPKSSRTPQYILQLIQSGMSPQDAAARYNSEFGTTEAAYYDPSAHNGHATIGLPGSYLSDEDNWSIVTNRMAENGGGSPAPAATAGSTSGGGDGGSALSSFLQNWLSSPSTGQTANHTALFQRLMGLADTYSAPVTADDPNIKASSEAYHGQTARAVQNFRTRAAERAHAEGVGTGSFDSQIGNAEMAAGRSEASNTTSMMQTELQSRRANLMSTLQQAGAQLSASDQAELQSKIAAIDGLLRGQSNTLTSRGQDITSQLGNKGLDITQLLGQGAQDIQRTGVGNQNNQFYDKLGVDSASNTAQLDYLWKSLGLK